MEKLHKANSLAPDYYNLTCTPSREREFKIRKHCVCESVCMCVCVCWREREQGRESRLNTFYTAAAAAKSLQSCPTLCNPMDSSPPGSPVPGILKARTLEWVAISFSNAGKWKVKVKSLSCVRPSATPWTAAFQAPPSMGFSRQEYWSGVPLLNYKKIDRLYK